MGLLGAGIERFGLRHVHKHGPVAEILFTFGLAYLIAVFVVMLWGRNPIENRVPAVIDFSIFSLFGTTYPFYKVLMMAISVGIFTFLYLAFKRTRMGLVIQASLTHPHMVGALGHDVPRIFVFIFAMGSALAGLAGVIGGFALLTEPNLECERSQPHDRRRGVRPILSIGRHGARKTPSVPSRTPDSGRWRTLSEPH